MTTVFIGFQVACWIAGAGLLFRLARSAPSALPRWEISLEQFVTAVLLVLGGGFLLPQALPYVSNTLLGPAARDGDWWIVVQGTAFQLGMLGGAGIAALLQIRRQADADFPPPLPRAELTCGAVIGGAVTFLIALPLVSGTGFVWKLLLERLGVDPGEQEMVDLFRNADDPARLAWMCVLAAVVAPVTEELVFRAGLFRYLQGRVTRPFALCTPALIFAALHANVAAFVPLFVLGVLFAVAYERTGRVAVPMIAHALFNLNTILMIMTGVTA